MNLSSSQLILPANSSMNTFSLPFDNLFYSEKGSIEYWFDLIQCFYFQGQLAKRIQSVHDQIIETSSQSIVVSIDRIFAGSARLDGDSIGNILIIQLTACISCRFDFQLHSFEVYVMYLWMNYIRLRHECSVFWKSLKSRIIIWDVFVFNGREYGKLLVNILLKFVE